MTVVVRKRKQSGFEVFDQLSRIRVEITNLIFRDFGFNYDRIEMHAGKLFGQYYMDELRKLNPEARELKLIRITEDVKHYIKDASQTVKDLLRQATAEVHIANDIIPTRWAEYDERRIRQDRAVGYLHVLTLELESIIDDLPVNANVFFRIATLIDREIGLIKSWRLYNFTRKLKKLAGVLPEDKFFELYYSWFRRHLKYMSKIQRTNLESLYHQLKEKSYGRENHACT